MKTASIFSSRMVLQRDLPVPVWGWSTPGDAITVEFAGQTKTAVTGQVGKWTVTLDPLPACVEPRELVIQSQSEGSRQVLTDVLVGDVWLGSGQSNMEWPVSLSNNSSSEIAAANYPNIRLFTVPVRTKGDPDPDVEGEWKVCSPETIPPFSAVAYFFGRELNRELGVPVGLIHASKGGTCIEAWTSRDSLVTEPAGRRAVEGYENMLVDPPKRAELDLYAKDPGAWLRSRVAADPGDTGFSQGWAGLDFNDAAWGEMDVPTKWQTVGHAYSGVFWFRRVVEIPAGWADRELVLNLGACDKHDTTWFNNVQVGATGWDTPTRGATPASIAFPGNSYGREGM